MEKWTGADSESLAEYLQIYITNNDRTEEAIEKMVDERLDRIFGKANEKLNDPSEKRWR